MQKVWKHCMEMGITLGRVPLGSKVTDDDDGILKRYKNDGSELFSLYFISRR